MLIWSQLKVAPRASLKPSEPRLTVAAYVQYYLFLDVLCLQGTLLDAGNKINKKKSRKVRSCPADHS